MNKRLTVLLLVGLSLGVCGCSSLPTWMGGEPKKKDTLVGDRIAVLPVGVDMQPDASLKDAAVSLPPAISNPNWPQHTGVVTFDTANLAGGSFEHVSQATIGDGDAFDHTLIPRPVVANGVVFAMDATGHVSAHNASNIGETGWKSKGVSEEDSPEIMGGGLAWNDGKLYAASGRGVVAALDAATGKELWRKAMRVPFRSAPKVADGKLFVTTIDNEIYAISADNGEVLWNQRGITETAGLMNSVSPAMAGEYVIVPFSSGEIYAIAPADGKPLWSESLSPAGHTHASAAFGGIGGDPVVDGPVIFVVSSSGMFSALSVTNGQHAWDRPFGAYNTPWVAGDNIFLLTNDNTLVAMEKYSGKIRWSTKLEGFANMEEKRDPITWRGPVLVDGRLAVVSSNGQLLLISATDGKVAATHSVADGIYTPPVVAGGIMYLVGQDATLYALQ